MSGMARMIARSWTSRWVLPTAPISSPEYDATILTFAWLWATSIRIGSRARWVKKTVNEEVQGTNPTEASPAAAPTRFCSAIPIWKKRSG